MGIMPNPFSLNSFLKAQIKKNGPMTVFEFMTQALYHPQKGYYAQKIPIGKSGDYITAPEMTQVFGEIIALWFIDLWQKAHQPELFHLVEIGPGRGTLMIDILRTFQALKVPLTKMTVHLIEVSSTLKAEQQYKFSDLPYRFFWHQDFSTLPKNQGFCCLIANEFWDALPLQQFTQINDEWIERCIDIHKDEFIFIPQEKTAIREISPMMPCMVSQIADHLKINSGAALFFDYGYDRANATGDTLQALFHHQHVSPLTHVGQADLTHHVNFHQLKTLFKQENVWVEGPISQGEFLKQNGLELRTEQLCKIANSQQQAHLKTAAMRLTHPSQMGELFKVLWVTNPSSLNI